MLWLTPLSELASVANVFPDHADPTLLHLLPSRLALATTGARLPDFFLARYRGASVGGGLLRMRHRLLRDEAMETDLAAGGWKTRPVVFEGGQFRLRLRSPLEDAKAEVGDWYDLLFAGDEIYVPAVGLNEHETQLIRDLLEQEAAVIDLEVQLNYRGLVPVYPWIVSIQAEPLFTLLSSQLDSQPARADQIVAAFLSLPDVRVGERLIEYHALESGATMPARDVILAEVAVRALDRLFRCVPESGLYTLDPEAFAITPVLSWDVRTPRLETRQHLLTWSVSDLYHETLDEDLRGQLFPSVQTITPFERATVHIVNQLPIDPDHLRRVGVDVRFIGEQGVPEFASYDFRGEDNVAQFTTFFPALTNALDLAYRVTTVMAPPGGTGWPIVKKRDYVPVESLILEIDPDAIEFQFLCAEVDPELFDHTAGVDLAVTDTDDVILKQVRLLPGKRTSWIPLPGAASLADLTVMATALPPTDADGTPYLLYQGAVTGGQLRLPAYLLEVLEPDRIELSLAPDVASHFVGVWIEIRDQGNSARLLPLEPDRPLFWNHFRASVFDPVRYEYRLQYIARKFTGETLPLAITDWTAASETSLLVRPPVPE